MTIRGGGASGAVLALVLSGCGGASRAPDDAAREAGADDVPTAVVDGATAPRDGGADDVSTAVVDGATTRDGGACPVGPVRFVHDGAAPGAPVVHFLDAPRYPDARCNDGTPAAFFLRRGTGDAARRWVIYLEGGGSCLTPEGCAARPQSLSSTAGFNRRDGQTVSMNFAGIASADPTANPDFYDATYVQLNYCSSDLWSGERAATPGAPTTDLARFHFRGRTIVRDAVAELLRAHGLGEAREVFFMGSSAGGAGTLANVDDVRDTLPPSVRFVALADGIYSVPYPAFDPATQRESAAGETPPWVGTEARLAAWNPRGDASCIARYGLTSPTCNSSARLLATQEIATPLLVVDSQMDSNQLGDLGAANPANAAMQAFAQRYAAKRAVFPTLDPRYGLFSLFSTIHVLINKRDPWATARVGADALPAAIGAWYRDPCAGPMRIIDSR
jgi:hypothetical protein